MKRLLGKNLTEPPEIRPTLGCCLVDVFTSVSTNEMREMMLKEFCKPDTALRLLIATTAFGLGVDCPDIVRVINYGLLKNWYKKLDVLGEMDARPRLFSILKQ